MSDSTKPVKRLHLLLICLMGLAGKILCHRRSDAFYIFANSSSRFFGVSRQIVSWVVGGADETCQSLKKMIAT